MGTLLQALARRVVSGVVVGCSIGAICLMVSACGGSDGSSQAAATADCASCHQSEATAFVYASSHQVLFDCEFCHDQRADRPGPGHRAIPTCDPCHSEAGHPPDSTCTVCHDPHGSANLFLIRSLVRIPEGTSASIVFQDLSGRADGSYAELPASAGGRNGREAGEGLCEVCHTTTRFYDRYGSGESHRTTRCVNCHDHARGFLASAR